MKYLMSLTFLAMMAFSINTHAQAIPVCDEAMSVAPCTIPAANAKEMVIDMMLENKAGVRMVHRAGRNGLMLSMFRDESNVTITLLSQVNREDDYQNVTKFEIYMSDCRGTDACEGDYLWTVTSSMKSDGYSYRTKYTNTLKKVAIP